MQSEEVTDCSTQLNNSNDQHKKLNGISEFHFGHRNEIESEAHV